MRQKGNAMSKYYRELAPNELGGRPDDLHFDGRAFRPIEVDDMPEVKKLRDCLKHLSWSNHGFKPESCSHCEQARKLLDEKITPPCQG